VLQVVRYWVIASPGRFWTHRIVIVLALRSRAPALIAMSPNYAVTVIETFVLPLAFGALALAIIMTSLWWVALGTRSGLRTRHFSSRRA